MIIVLNNPSLIDKLMDHLVQEGVTKITAGFVEVSADKDGGRVVVVAEVSAGAGDSDRYDLEDTAKVLLVELIKPTP